ncbi:amidase [Actinomadura sp. DC4]|uniref:amidase n=1 Tax=Actinomadura sp. DC4 TaxID=3055069 RepID=UPI0025B24C19|nr:amidase [Actinomadura sp. DC4]MDN3353643.1 amidase [Actinomadura sp. DC4]
MTGASARVRVARSLAAIERLDGRLRACVLVRQEATEEAGRIDRAARPGPLAGWTIAVKDNMDVAGTVRSDGLGPPYRPPAERDSEPVRRLRAAGAVVIAKANLEELSFGATTQNPTWGPCRNPWDLTRIPGGSSGGSAVAVAAGLAHAALGTDTGGSLRNPASFCGVSTLRPTHGAVPVAGVTPLSPSLDVVGPMARSVRDLRPLFAALAALPISSSEQPLAGLAVGVPDAYFLDDLEPDVARGFEDLLTLLRDHGACLRSVSLPLDAGAVDAMAELQNAEAARALRDHWDDPRLSPGIRDRMRLGRAVTREREQLAAGVAEQWRRTVREAFERVMVVVTPATPFTAPPIAAGDLVTLSRRINRCTGAWSLTRAPVLGLPVTPARDGLPVGAQIVGAPASDWRLLGIGEAIQSVSGWHERVPAPA